jgi:hypothetical protein
MKLYYDGKKTWTAIETEKGFEVWSYEPCYDWDGNTYHCTVETIDDARQYAVWGRSAMAC